MDNNEKTLRQRPKDCGPFEGFPAELPDFLWGLALHNERPWFAEHKEQFERCLQRPMNALAYQVQAQMEESFPGECGQIHISRIYRDARRLYGRGPYNDHLWFSLGVSAGIYDPTPKFWFGIDAKGCVWGMGMWQAGADYMTRWRERIDNDPKPLEKIIRKINQAGYFQPDCDVYKRPKGDPGPLLYDWYNARGVGVIHSQWHEPTVPGPQLAQTLAEDFSSLMPLYRYMAGI